MNFAYTFASARVKALEPHLLNENQVERLFGAVDKVEELKVLQDTFLAVHLAGGETDIERALETDLVETKKLLASIAPASHLLDILWLRYDFLNLKTIIKGRRAGLTNDEILARCSDVSKWPKELLLRAFEGNTLQKLDSALARAARLAETAKDVYEIDLVKNKAYLEKISSIALVSNEPFIREYVALLIDSFNLKSALRKLALPEISHENVFVSGGSIPHKISLDSKDTVFSLLKTHGGDDTWKTAFAEFEQTGDYTLLEKTADDILLDFVRVRAYDLMSPAPLFAYFNAKKSGIQIIRSITIAKENKLPEAEIRKIVRNSYHGK